MRKFIEVRGRVIFARQLGHFKKAQQHLPTTPEMSLKNYIMRNAAYFRWHEHVTRAPEL